MEISLTLMQCPSVNPSIPKSTNPSHPAHEPHSVGRRSRRRGECGIGHFISNIASLFPLDVNLHHESSGLRNRKDSLHSARSPGVKPRAVPMSPAEYSIYMLVYRFPSPSTTKSSSETTLTLATSYRQGVGLVRARCCSREAPKTSTDILPSSVHRLDVAIPIPLQHRGFHNDVVDMGPIQPTVLGGVKEPHSF